ncbi:MAG TPA: MaoC family dehydratase [Candidatus Limnocylindrales bacterium]|nr:MaoC family dehydratase [Candidatus Limnocylindrales bacterium]
MNVNGEPVYVGRDFGGRELVIDRALVERYQKALDHRLPLYDEVAPALVLHSECYEDLSWYLANFWGNLHARQEWELFAPIAIGTPVRTRGFIRDRYRKRGRDYVVKETWVLDAGGRLLNRGLTHQSFVIDNAAAGTVAVDKEREKRSDRRFEIGGRGVALEPLERTVTEPVCMAFSGPTENYHTNRKVAQAFGFPDIVVQGMLPICVASELLTRHFGLGFLAGGKMDVRLVNVLWADETIRACAEEVEEVPEADRRRVHLDVWVEKADGTRVVVGTASALR